MSSRAPANPALVYADCRTFGHWWLTVESVRAGGVWTLRLRCEKCKTVRTDHVSRRGEVASRRYEYADGYLTKSKDDIMDRTQWRLEYLSKLR